MHKFEKFLFFYSIIAVTGLFVSFGVSSPKPLNFISIFLITPIIFYFWVKLTSPEKVSAERWSLRFLFILTLISAMSIFGFYLSKNYINNSQKKAELIKLEEKIASLEKTNKNLTLSIASLSSKKINIDSSTFTDLVLGSPNPVRLSTFTGKKGTTSITVYASPSLSAKKISTLDGSQTYLYLIKKDGWYNIIISESEMGWVSASQVDEVQ